ncbi:MAG: type 4a pilus biogenesis protein PilO [Candidatus Omnitrophica bacterium]|nr:type 4a pilus biogenesis protein PilO [Candidatus Omnitrophota bacterium]
MFKLNISKRENSIFIALGLVVILFLTYHFIVKPIFKKWHTLNSEIITEKNRLRKGLELLKNRDNIIGEYNTYATTLRKISKILSYIETKAGSLDVKIANIKPMPQPQKDFHREYLVEVQIEGEFANISKFIAELIKPPLVITLKKFDLRTMPDQAPSQFKGILILSKLII